MITLSPGAIGVIIKVKIIKSDGSAEDISSATRKEIHFHSLNSLYKACPASFVTDGKDGYLQYITNSENDLDKPGLYMIRCFITMTGYSGLTNETEGFTVK